MPLTGPGILTNKVTDKHAQTWIVLMIVYTISKHNEKGDATWKYGTLYSNSNKVIT